ncbi:hypothetical protein [Pseudodesulfovibrio portus]|nr:hypothetical protein [Pseudodesulfovibrio portus]
MLFSLPTRAADNVLLVSFNSFPPSKVKTEDGSYGGSDIDMLQLLAERMGLLVEFDRILKAQHSRAREQRQQKGPIPTQLP